MSAALKIVRAGILATMQDAGRIGHGALGVPRSGALDAMALHLANRLLGNAPDTAALETLYAGLTVEAVSGPVRLALACAAGTIERPYKDAADVPAWSSVLLRPGERLRVAAPAQTAAAYLAVEGGLDVAPVLGSASTDVQGRLGGWHGRALRAGDVLPLTRPADTTRGELQYDPPPALAMPTLLRVIPGEHGARFAEDAMERLLAGEYRVSPASNRAGIRLQGACLPHRDGHDLLSEGVATGAIQVPGSGQPVILLADHPTVGGYPQLAVIIAADLAAAGRLRIGASVRFAEVDAAGAAAARGARQDWLERTLDTLRAAG